MSTLLFAAIVVFGIVYYATHKEDFHLMTSVSPLAVVVLLSLEAVHIVCLGVQVKLLTDHYNLGLTFFQWFGLARMTSLTNLMFGFGAGASVKGVYLKKFHDLKYSSFIAATGIAVIIKLLVGGLFALALLLFSGQATLFLLLIASAIVAGTLGFLLIGHKLPQGFLFSWSRLSALVQEWRSIRANHKLIAKLVVLSVVLFAIYTLEIYFAFDAFASNASLAASGIIAVFDGLSGALKLIPGNLGVKEAVFATISVAYGLTVNEALHAALLHRVIRTAVSLVLAPGFVYPLIRQGQVASDAYGDQKITS
ncbi:MAG: lysylphosphatidylglycerol synthase transmembrane domain-containing protein [Candidatus Binatia bacterium]